jgi:hypothetical protein
MFNLQGSELYLHQIQALKGPLEGPLLHAVNIITLACRLEVDIPIESITPGSARRLLEKAYFQALKVQSTVVTAQVRAVKR